MRIVRTIIMVFALIGFLIFAIYNWKPVELTLWQNLVLETKVPVLAVLALLIGFVPMWAFHRSVTWNLNRRIRALENSLKHTAMSRPSDAGAPGMTPVADISVDKPGKNTGATDNAFDTADGGSDGGGGK